MLSGSGAVGQFGRVSDLATTRSSPLGPRRGTARGKTRLPAWPVAARVASADAHAGLMNNHRPGRLAALGRQSGAPRSAASRRVLPP